MAHPNEELISRAFVALCEGDETTVAGLLDDKVALHYPGRSPLAGDYVGQEEVVKWVRRGSELVGGKSRVALTSAYANDERGVVLYVTSAKWADKIFHERSVAVLSLRQGKVAEVWIIPADQYASDQFWSSTARRKRRGKSGA